MIVRELVHVISFKLNTAQLASVEARVQQLGTMMSFITTVPIVLLGKSFLEASLNMDTLSLSIQTYSTSAEEASRVTEDLKKLAVELPTVQIKDLNESVGNLLARGVESKDLVDTFRTFAVITGATGGNMKGLVKAYTDTMGKGKLAGQEFNQFINASVPLNKALKAFTGKSVDTLKKMQKDGKITFEMLRDALKGLAAEGGQFASIMTKKGELLWGQWQKFLDQLYYLKAELGKKLEVPLKFVLEVLGKIVDTLKGLDGNWKRFFIIALGVTAIIGPLVVMFFLLKQFAGPLKIISAAIAAISIALDEIYVWSKHGDSVLQDVFGDIDQYIPKFKELKDLLTNIFSNIGLILKDVLLDLAALLRMIMGDKERRKSWLDDFLTVLKAIAAVINTVLIGMREIEAIAMSPFRSDEENKGKIASIVSSASNTPVLRKAVSIGNTLNEITSGIDSWIEKWDTRIGSFFNSNYGANTQYGVGQNLPFMLQGMGTGKANSALSEFKPTVNLTVNAPSGNSKDLVPAVKAAIADSLKEAENRWSRNIKVQMAQ